MRTVYPDPRIIIALDFRNAKEALALLTHCDPTECRVKIGHELFTAAGVPFLKQVQQLGFSVFLDLKYHDIPNTVANAVKVAADLGVWMVNLHCLGGSDMMSAASRALVEYGDQKPLLIGVSVLTSHTESTLHALGIAGSVSDTVLHLAKMAQGCKLDGLVCSAREALYLKKACGQDFCLVTPGIRLPTDQSNDQHRIMTPQQAIANGADYLVIGRPVTQAPCPKTALTQIQTLIH